MIEVEICTPSAASARAAKAGGATRVELCRDLEVGGLTPRDEDIALCVHELGLRTHVLIRPRAGNFYYNATEVAEIMQSIERCRKMGVHCVVVGFLDYEGRVDISLTRQAVYAAGPMEVTFHRAFDEALQDPMEALLAVAASGCTRLLTSGQRPTALEGADVIKTLVDANLVKILAGSGITPSNATQVVQLTGVQEVHGSCKTRMPDGSIQTDAQQVREMLSLLGSSTRS